MSIRIHELAKRHSMDAAAMMALLKMRGYIAPSTRSISSTVSRSVEEKISGELAKTGLLPVAMAASPAANALRPNSEPPPARPAAKPKAKPKMKSKKSGKYHEPDDKRRNRNAAWRYMKDQRDSMSD